MHPEDREVDAEHLRRLLAGEIDAYQLQQRCRRGDGEAISVLASVWLHADPAGRPRYVVRQLVELDERRRAEEQLAWRATHDALTGLPNRTLFRDRLDMTLARLGRDPGLAAVLVLDLDSFREVAERFGNDAVDRLLVALAGRLSSILRPSDTVARLGSDEFAVLCHDLGHERDAVRLAERIVAGLATPFAVGGQEIVITASIGIALAGVRRPQPAESLLRDADRAMRLAKQRPGTTWDLAGEAVSDQLAERLATEAALRRAVEAAELHALYQPIVSLREGRVIGVEALARWEQPGRGLVMPADFVPFAEETGLAATTLKRLTALGVRIAVDDFGTGYSSLASLQHLPISSLKIDRSFVARLDLDPGDDAMVTAVIGLAHTLGLDAIAEGVETAGQLARLDALGCDYAQGYLFARPEPGGRVGELLGQDRRWQ